MRFLAIALASLAAGAVVGLVRHGDAGTGDASAAIPQRIVFSSGDAVHEVDLSGRHRRVIARHFHERIHGIAPLPDGSLVLSVQQKLLRYDGNGKRIAGLGAGYSPAASPNGTRLAFAIYDEDLGESQIWLMNLDGSDRRRLTSGGYDTLPAWSPDGDTILYTHYGPEARTADTPDSWLQTVPVAGGEPERLTSSKLDLAGRYSPDGQWITFGSSRDRVADDCGDRKCFFIYAYVMRADGSDAHRVTSDPLFDLPFFATATTIVYGRAADGYDELYRIELDGSCRARITRDVLLDEAAAVPPGAVPPASGCLPSTPVRELPAGPNFDGLESSTSIAAAAKRRGIALYWLGESMSPLALATIVIDNPSEHSLTEPVHLSYHCLADGEKCSRRVWITMSPACSGIRYFANRAHLDTFRGVPRVRRGKADYLLIGTTVVSVSGELPQDRDRAERQLRSLNTPLGRTGPGEKFPAPPKGLIDGRTCPKTG
jgi:WD40-like Beta Propeller Repeat